MVKMAKITVIVGQKQEKNTTLIHLKWFYSFKESNVGYFYIICTSHKYKISVIKVSLQYFEDLKQKIQISLIDCS